MIRRRVLALLAGAAMPLPFAAGEPSRVFRLGILAFSPPGPGIRALERRLQTLGWKEGRNLRIDYVQLDETDAGRAGWKRLGPVVTTRSRSLGRRVSAPMDKDDWGTNAVIDVGQVYAVIGSSTLFSRG